MTMNSILLNNSLLLVYLGLPVLIQLWIRHSYCYICYLLDFLLQCKSDSYGEEELATDSSEEGDSSEYDSEDGFTGNYFDDSDSDMYPSSPVPNSGGNLI